MLSMQRGGDETDYNVLHNGIEEKVDSVLQIVNPDIPFQQIFEKTYLGSVPAESFLLSVSGETKEQFRDRLVKIFSKDTTPASLKGDLSYKGKYHLKVLSSNSTDKVDAKLQVIANYVNEVKEKVNLDIFKDLANYQVIQQRKELRYYFRHKDIKQCSFVYEINPNPQPSFYFTSNPSAGSTDYFGYCEFDITRNSSPGCCRTVPLENASNNIKDEFKKYWKDATDDLPIDLVFSYIQYVSKSDWYKKQKKLRKRFYFCLPKVFMKDWLSEVDTTAEAKTIKSFISKKMPKEVEKFGNGLFEMVDNG